MKLVSYNKDEQDQLAVLMDGLLYDTDLMHPDLPVSMAMFLNYWEELYPPTAVINQKLEEGSMSRKHGVAYDTVEILTPVPHATSFRSARAFHTLTASGTDKPDAILQMDDQYPPFYFGNHNCFQGSGDVICMPGHLEKLDFEVSVAIVICKAGKNIKAVDADDYIGGYMILNNISARNFAETDLSAANGKGFAIPTGPMLVTADELEPYKVDCKPNHTGSAYNLSIKCLVNDLEVSEGNLADMEWTFAEIIENASYGVQLFPGDIISSGPVTGGCFLQINTIGKLNDSGYKEQWLKEGDVVEIEAEALGRLRNTIVKDEVDFSLSETTEDE